MKLSTETIFPTFLLFFALGEVLSSPDLVRKLGGGHFEQKFASKEVQHEIEKRKHDGSSIVGALHRGTLSEVGSNIRHFHDVDKRSFVDGAREHDVDDPPVYVKEVGDEHVTSGTFLMLEYINHANYSCTKGFVDLNRNSGLLSVQGIVLGKCNPHYKTIDTLTLKYDNSFERHWTVYEYFNCTGNRVVYSRSYPPTSTCSGDFKYMYQSSEVMHERFPELQDKIFIMPQGVRCYNDRQRLLSFELHNETISKFDINQCWNMYYYTILVEAVNLTIVEQSTLIGQKFESRDDQKCASYPVKVEGWVLNRCETLGDDISTKMNWVDLGRHTGYLFVGYSFYNTYDCTGLPELTIYHHYGTPDVCAHGAIVFSHSAGSALSWRDWTFDSHMIDFSSQLCNDDRLYHWATYNSHCVMKENERVQFDNCLRYNLYQDMDDDALNPYTSFQAYCHDNDIDDDNICIHTSSTVSYKERIYSFHDFFTGLEPECSVAHTVQARGVVITASCENVAVDMKNTTLRVTDTHLVATPEGFQLAYSLKPGSVVFSGLGDDRTCTVTSVLREDYQQSYFGLNCVHSEILVNGIRVSTFGDFHTLPSWYMTYVGSLVGPAVASTMGEYIARLYYEKTYSI